MHRRPDRRGRRAAARRPAALRARPRAELPRGGAWVVGWLLLSLSIAVPMSALDGAEAAVNYTTVYLIERTLSLDNLFVFLLIFAYFARARRAPAGLLFWGIVLALVLRGFAILVGVELIERFDMVSTCWACAAVPRLADAAGRPTRTSTPSKPLRARDAQASSRSRRGWRARTSSSRGRQPQGDAGAARAGQPRRGRHRLRGRLDPGGVCDHDRLVRRSGRPTPSPCMGLRALFVARRGADRALPLPRRDARRRARPGRRQAAYRGPRARRPVASLAIIGCFTVGIRASLLADRREDEDTQDPGTPADLPS